MMQRAKKKAKRRPAEKAIDVDLATWRVAASKLSVRESGELVRAITRAQSLKRPNRDQRMLLAIFTRQPSGGPAS